MPNYYAEGRTALRMQCPHCGAYSDHPTEKTDPSRYRWDDQATEIFKELLGEDLSFRQRTKRCKKCKRSFMTIEMSKNYLGAMINGLKKDRRENSRLSDRLDAELTKVQDLTKKLREIRKLSTIKRK